MRTRLASPLALLAAGALAFSAVFTLASASAQPGANPPAAGASLVIGVIDLEKILDQCKEGQDERARLKANDDATEAELRKLADKLKELGTRLDTMPKDDPARSQVVGEYNGRLAEAKTRKETLERETARAYGSTMWRLYARIDDTVNRYAAENNLDAVFVFDELKAPKDPEKVSPTSVQAISQSRAIIYRSPRLDITTAIVNKMNTEYAATGGSKPAPAAVPPAPANNNAARPNTPPAQPKGAPKKKGG
jgi:Skp family chaperone for outer membrane proteins